MSFRGATKVTIDDKGRVVVPAHLRGPLAGPGDGRLVVTADRDSCLLRYSVPEWDRIEAELNALPSLHPQVRRLQRLMVGHAEFLTVDSHGRIALTPELREYAGLDRAALFAGTGKRVELWDEARWNAQREE